MTCDDLLKSRHIDEVFQQLERTKLNINRLDHCRQGK
jgi:hypothetical protein